MPAAAITPFLPLITSGLGLGMGYLGQKQQERDAAPLNNANQQAAIAQADAVRQNEARKSELYNMFSGGFDNAGDAWKPGMAGSQGPESQDAFANLVRAAMTRGMMGIAQPSGTGLAQGMGNQSFLEGQQSGQDLSSSAEALADSILSKYGNQDGNYTSPGYGGSDTVRISDLFPPIQPIEEGNASSGTLPPSPF